MQVTVDTYGHLIPGANVCFVDRLDEVSAKLEETTPQPSRNMAKWSLRRISCKLLMRLVAARGLEPRTYGL
jgi:hypothetical protein